MKTAFIIIIMVLIPVGGQAADKWSSQDIALEGVYLGLMVLDWGTTLDIAERPREYREFNPFLGAHPARAQVNVYFLASGILHVGITHFLPAKCRPYWQAVTIGISGASVANNLSIGLKFAW